MNPSNKVDKVINQLVISSLFRQLHVLSKHYLSKRLTENSQQNVLTTSFLIKVTIISLLINTESDITEIISGHIGNMKMLTNFLIKFLTDFSI